MEPQLLEMRSAGAGMLSPGEEVGVWRRVNGRQWAVEVKQVGQGLRLGASAGAVWSSVGRARMESGGASGPSGVRGQVLVRPFSSSCPGPGPWPTGAIRADQGPYGQCLMRRAAVAFLVAASLCQGSRVRTVLGTEVVSTGLKAFQNLGVDGSTELSEHDG